MIINKYTKTIIFLVSLLSTNIGCSPVSQFTKPPTLPKYFAIDVDGTFYSTNTASLDKNAEALRKLKDKNVVPFFCTGQYFPVIKLFFNQDFVNKSGYNFYPGVYSNGALVYDSQGNVVNKLTFSPQFLRNFVNFVKNNNLKQACVFLATDKMLALQEVTQYVDQLTTGMTPEFKTEDEIVNEEILMIRVKGVDLDVQNSKENVDYIVFGGGDYTKYLSPPGALKENGLQKLLDKLGGKTDECAYIGDGYNDLGSMKLPGVLSFAVGNAKSTVKQQATWELDVNYDNAAFDRAVNLLFDD